jgi:hypothetical protein
VKLLQGIVKRLLYLIEGDKTGLFQPRRIAFRLKNYSTARQAAMFVLPSKYAAGLLISGTLWINLELTAISRASKFC